MINSDRHFSRVPLAEFVLLLLIPQLDILHKVMGHSTTRKKDPKIQEKTSKEGGLTSSYDEKAVLIQQGRRTEVHLSFSGF